MPPWQFRPAPPLRAAIVVSAWLSHAVLITIYWNLAWPVRLPLPISPCVNASANPFGGSGLMEHRARLGSPAETVSVTLHRL